MTKWCKTHKIHTSKRIRALGCVVQSNTHSRTQTNTDLFSPVSDSTWSAARCQPACKPDFYLLICVSVSICLCSSTLTFIFLICGVTTYGLVDQTRPAANNLSWNTFRGLMTSDSKYTQADIHTFFPYKYQTQSSDKAEHEVKTLSLIHVCLV